MVSVTLAARISSGHTILGGLLRDARIDSRVLGVAKEAVDVEHCATLVQSFGGDLCAPGWNLVCSFHSGIPMVVLRKRLPSST